MIALTEYRARRNIVAKKMPADAIAIIPAATEMIRNGDAHYRFRQDSDFYYLTGFSEPNALLVIVGGDKPMTLLFNRPRDPHKEQWNGKRLGQDDAPNVLGVDAAYSIDTIDSRLPELLMDKHVIYYPLGRFPEWHTRVMTAWERVKGQVRRGINAPHTFCDSSPIIAEMRLIKSTAEIAILRQAAAISVAAHERAMRVCMRLDNERQLEAELVYECLRHGCASMAYDPIVAGGAHACILHYTENNAVLRKGDLVLIDAAGEYQNYAADITRTFPIKGVFSEEQRHIYTLVLAAQQAGMAAIRPGLRWNKIQEVIVAVLTEGLVDLGILIGDVPTLIEQKAYLPFYMHQSGHWLGLDVHDTGRYNIDGQWRVLEPGMTLTVEPGLYIQAGTPNVDERWWNIGIRIEDDILVTETGFTNLTGALVSQADDVEEWMRNG